MLVTIRKAGVVQKYVYDAYGNNNEGSFTGSNNIGYNSKKYDSGTGWYDYGFRDYDSRTGRFTTVDPIRDGMNWYAYCGGDPINYVDLWGLSRESDKKLLKVSVVDAYGFQDAATRYLLGGKEGVAGQTPIDGIALTNADGQVIHTFTNDKAIKQYANYLDNEKGNISDVMGNLSTITGIMSDISELPGVSKVSQVSGGIKLASDIKKVIDNPTEDNITDLAIDGIGYIPNGGAIASYVLSETKESVEVIEEMKKEYQINETIEKFLPFEQRNKNMEHVIEKTVWQEIKSLFGGK